MIIRVILYPSQCLYISLALSLSTLGSVIELSTSRQVTDGICRFAVIYYVLYMSILGGNFIPPLDRTGSLSVSRPKYASIIGQFIRLIGAEETKFMRACL